MDFGSGELVHASGSKLHCSQGLDTCDSGNDTFQHYLTTSMAIGNDPMTGFEVCVDFRVRPSARDHQLLDNNYTLFSTTSKFGTGRGTLLPGSSELNSIWGPPSEPQPIQHKYMRQDPFSAADHASAPRNWTLHVDQCTSIKPLGNGSGGRVDLVNASGLGQVAVKWISAPGSLKRELATHSCFKHPHIVGLHGRIVGDNSEALAICMEYCSLGCLRSYIDGNNRLQLLDVCHIGLQACSAIHHIHACGKLHMDVKSANIMLVPSTDPRVPFDVRVGDFGLSEDVREKGHHENMRGTLLYMAPELITSDINIPVRSTALDVYSLGVVLRECVQGKLDTDGLDEGEIQDLIKSGRPLYRETANGLGQELAGLIDDCCSIDPTHRPSTKEIYDRLQCIKMDNETENTFPPPSYDPVLHVPDEYSDSAHRNHHFASSKSSACSTQHLNTYSPNPGHAPHDMALYQPLAMDYFSQQIANNGLPYPWPRSPDAYQCDQALQVPGPQYTCFPESIPGSTVAAADFARHASGHMDFALGYGECGGYKLPSAILSPSDQSAASSRSAQTMPDHSALHAEDDYESSVGPHAGLYLPDDLLECVGGISDHTPPNASMQDAYWNFAVYGGNKSRHLYEPAEVSEPKRCVPSLAQLWAPNSNLWGAGLLPTGREAEPRAPIFYKHFPPLYRTRAWEHGTLDIEYS